MQKKSAYICLWGIAGILLTALLLIPPKSALAPTLVIVPSDSVLSTGVPIDSSADSIVKNDSSRMHATKPCININTADTIALCVLPGVGPVLAGRIIAYRRTSGAYKTTDDLRKVKGIGVKKIEKIRPYVCW